MTEEERLAQGRIQRSFYIDAALYRRLKIQAAMRDWSISDAINVAIDNWLETESLTHKPDLDPGDGRR